MRTLSKGIALLFLFQLGASAPQSSADHKPSSSTAKGDKTKTSMSAMMSPQSVGDEIAKFFGRKTGKELMAEKARNMSGSGAATAQGFVEKSSGRTASSIPGYVPPPPTPRVSVPQIRQEIQRILELNRQIKTVQSGSSVQLQRVQDQARIHQQILNDLESPQKPAGNKPPVRNALLSQEKIRIIHEETQRNTQMIADLKAVPANVAKNTTPKVTQDVTSKTTLKVTPKATENMIPKTNPKVTSKANTPAS